MNIQETIIEDIGS